MHERDPKPLRSWNPGSSGIKRQSAHPGGEGRRSFSGMVPACETPTSLPPGNENTALINARMRKQAVADAPRSGLQDAVDSLISDLVVCTGGGEADMLICGLEIAAKRGADIRISFGRLDSFLACGSAFQRQSARQIASLLVSNLIESGERIFDIGPLVMRIARLTQAGSDSAKEEAALILASYASCGEEQSARVEEAFAHICSSEPAGVGSIPQIPSGIRLQGARPASAPDAPHSLGIQNLLKEFIAFEVPEAVTGPPDVLGLIDELRSSDPIERLSSLRLLKRYIGSDPERADEVRLLLPTDRELKSQSSDDGSVERLRSFCIGLIRDKLGMG